MQPRRSHRLLSIAATSIAVSFLFGPSQSHAQSAEAEALFNDGNKLMAQGKLVAACDVFEASNRLEPRAGTLIRLGDCRERNRQLASAWSAYKDALARVKDPRKRQYATARATALAPKLSYLTVWVSEQSRVDGLIVTRNGKVLDPMLWNRSVPVDGGGYIIAGRAAGREGWQTTAHVPVEGGKVSVEVPRLKEPSRPGPAPAPPPRPIAAAPSRTPSAPSPAMPSRTPPAPPQTMPSRTPSAPPPTTPAPPPATPWPPPRTASAPPPAAPFPAPTAPFPPPSVTADAEHGSVHTTRRKVAYAVAGVAVAAVALGAVLGASANEKRDEAFELCRDPAIACAQADRSNELMEESHRKAHAANVLFGASVAAAIGAGVLWFTGAPPTANPRRIGVVPSVASGAGVAITGVF